MKYIILPIVLFLSACAGQAESFGWYHPQGGEYLFAFDKEQCEADVVQAAQADPQGPFFTCMRELGYYVVQNGEILMAPLTEPTIVAETAGNE